MKTDEELMVAASGGDMDSFEELVRRHQQGAINVAYRLVSDEHLARDLAQEAFLKVLEKAPDYRPTAKFRTYLYRVLTHLCIDHHRKKKADPIPEMSDRSSDQDSPSGVMIREERADRVRKAVQELPERQRTAIVLQHYEDMSYKEIALAMDCSESAVDSLLVRARRSLQEKLEDFS